MSFRYPLILFALVLPAALLIWVWASRFASGSRRTFLPFDHGLAGKGWLWWVTLSMAESAAPLLLAVAILLLAGPQKYGAPESRRRMTNIQFCIDVSGSMIAPFGEGTRYDGSMKAVDSFLDYRKGDSFGLTFFGHNYIHWCPLTTDPSAIRCSLPFMRPEVTPHWFGGTNIAKALQGCQTCLLEREEGDRMIVLVTDGFDFDLEGVATQLTQDFKKSNITVFTIIVGFHQIQDGIVNISRGTGGDAFTVNDPEALRAVFNKIDRMKQARVEKTIAEPMDDYGPFALAGLVLAVVELCCLFGLRYVPW